MELFTLNNLSFAYPQQGKNALDQVHLTVGEGEFVTLVGPSGCGKSTLLRQLKPALTPHGSRTGEILFRGKPLGELSLREQSELLGFVLQNPDNQIVTDKVWHELAFGLESMGYDTPTIRGRVAEMASFFGIQSWFYQDVSQLSGGQKQLLNLASVMAMQPAVLILDEPTSQLDPIAAAEFLATVGKINRELGTTILMTEHRLEEVLPMSDRVVMMEEGRILCQGTPQQVGAYLQQAGHGMFRAMPTPMRIFAAVESQLACPVTVREGRGWLNEYARTNALDQVPPERPWAYETEETVLALDDVWFRYEKDAPHVVRGLSLQVRRGEFLALVGGNGAGKTTALSLLSGLNRPQRGKVMVLGQEVSRQPGRFRGLLGVLPQNPQTLFVKKTLKADLEGICENQGELQKVARLCRLEGLLERHPYDLSGGEQQRAALAQVLLTQPQILLLDEPTKGLDAEFKAVFAQILEGLLQGGATIVMVSHDIEFCASHASRCALLFQGGIVTQGRPRAFFSGNSFYTTAANRMARHLLPQAVVAEDVIAACGGRLPPKPTLPQGQDGLRKEEEGALPAPAKQQPRPPRRPKLPKRTVAAAVMILLLIPLTLYGGVVWLGERKYYFISLLILLETMVPFFLLFQGRKPKARELLVLSVLCAIGVAGRGAFFMLPQFKPVLALVIIAGVSLGGEAGFLVGAVTMLVSNMLFTQGPWTPWQMFGAGVVGFVAGVLFHKGLLGRNRLSLSLFGGLAAIVIYGGVMNASFVLAAQGQVTWQVLVGAYVAGFPMDLVHGAATAFFLWVASQPMLDKLDRIQVKYGLVE